jgi:hypothetical protein
VDITTASLLKFLHVIVAMWFLAGLFGRNLTMGQASHAANLASIETLTQLAGRFDNLMVKPGSFIVFVLGVVTALEQGWPLLGSLEGGHSDWLFVSILVYLSIFPLVPLVFLPRSKRFEAAMTHAQSRDAVTLELKSALNDTAVRAAHAYELIAVGLVIFLMVTKPF